MIDPTQLNEEQLVEFLTGQGWFPVRSRPVAHARVLEAPLIRTSPPLLAIAIVEVDLPRGTHESYQLPLGFRPVEEDWRDDVVASLDGWTVYDALADPLLARELVELVRRDTTVPMEEATVEFRSSGGLDERLADARRLEPRSNTSVAFDEQLVLKVYRRLEPGINPELELLNFLTQRGFANVPPLVGWYAQTSRYIDATLGVLTRYVPVEVDGWTFALESLAGDPDSFSSLVARLGEVTGAMHLVLASDTSDPAFAPEEPSVESLALLAATLDEGIAEVFAGLPDDEAVAPIAGRGEEVRERLRLLSRMVGTGRVIRHHGDLHLGEVLWTGSDWLILDFEGSRGQPLGERRRKRSPLRDVASVLRSFAYAASVSSLTRGIEPPPGWEERARAEFLGGYLAQVEPSGLLPGGQQATETLLAIFELEKAVDELRYELEHRPDWVPIPVAAIQRLLESPLALTF